jgi:hypothetical protein
MTKNFKHKALLWGGIGLASVGIITTTFLVHKKKKQLDPVLALSDAFTNYFGEKGMLSNSYPRGVRNNNPGNLVLTSIKWKGKVPNEQNTDGHFEQFYTYADGVRAMIKDIMNDHKKGSKSVRKLIYEYSPPTENNTEIYINWVASVLGVSPDATITLSKDILKSFAVAIIKKENGTQKDGKVYLKNSHFESAYISV